MLVPRSLISRRRGVLAITVGVILSSVGAQAETVSEMKSRIVAEASKQSWVLDPYPYSGYTAGRFFLDGSIGLPDNHNLVGQTLLRSIVAGEFEIQLPVENAEKIADLPQYQEAQSICSRAPTRYWNGAREMSAEDVEKRREIGSSDITPYFS
jgi:hypothetical protein